MNKEENVMAKGWKRFFSPDMLLLVDLCLIVLLVFGTGMFLRYPEGDIIEHIHASFLVGEGKVPYRDFFEHHNPLLWYLFGGVVEACYGKEWVIGVVNLCTYVVFLVGLRFLYKIIVEFLGDRTAGLLSLIMILLPGVWLYYIYFKPDNYMLVCLVIGIYGLFCYLRDKKTKDLVMAFVLFAVGFLFLQKILLFAPTIGLVVLYFLVKKEIKLRDFLIALGAGVGVILLGVVWLLYEGIWDEYIRSCYVFNKELVSYAGENGKVIPTDLDLVVFGMGFLFGGALFVYKNKYFKIWYLIGLGCLLSKVCYFSPHLYYYYEAYFFAVVILMVSLMELAKENKMLKSVVIVCVQVYVALMAYYFVFDLFVAKQRSFNKWILSQVNRCDYVFTSGYNGNLFNKDLGFYWFLIGQTDVIGEKAGIKKIDDFNKLIEEKKPKILIVYNVYDRFLKLREEDVVVHKFDYEMIKKYYDKLSKDESVEFDEEKKEFVEKMIEGGIFKLKDEFVKNNCVYDKNKKEWVYE